MELLEKESGINAACSQVSNELRSGFRESVHERALLIALVEKGLTAQAQVPLPVVLWNRVVGEFYADIPVEGRVIVELKAAKALTDEHGARLLNDKKPPGLAGSLILAS